MLRRWLKQEPGQGALEFAIVLLLVSIVATFSLYYFSDAILASVIPQGYVLVQ